MPLPLRFKFDRGLRQHRSPSFKAEGGRVSVLFVLFCLTAGLLLAGLNAAENLPPKVDANSGPPSMNKLKIITKKTLLPLYVYGDESGRLAHFIPSGYMGDVNSLSSLTSSYDASAPASTGRMGHTSLRIIYTAKGKQGWAGIYWLSPANNWGTTKGAGFDLRKATKLTFWARGEKGGERISQFKVGGVNGPFPDSDSASLGPLTLTKDWQQFTIDLKKKDLRHIIGGFMILVRRSDNPHGVTFFLDEVVFRGNPEDETEFPMVKDDSDEDNSMASSFSGTTVNPPPAQPVVDSKAEKETAEFNRIKGLVLAKEEETAARAGRAAAKIPMPAAIKKMSAASSASDSSGSGFLFAEPIPTPGPWLRVRNWNKHD